MDVLWLSILFSVNGVEKNTFIENGLYCTSNFFMFFYKFPNVFVFDFFFKVKNVNYRQTLDHFK